MLYRKVPKTGEELSALGFGAMRFPCTDDGAIDEPRAIEQMRRSIDSGVNYVDTAWPYHGGMSEIVVGKALKDGYREKVKIADKLPVWNVESREDMDDILNRQLEKLQVECIDYYLLHALEGTSWRRLAELGVTDFLDAALADGRISNAGFSFHGIAEDFKEILDGYDWTFCQIQYNFLDQENQAGTAGLEYAASKGLAVMIMEPLRGGNLSRPDAPPDVKALWDTADIERAPVDWALRWVLNRPEVTVVLSGMNVDAHIEQNLSIASEVEAGSMTQAELDLVDKVAAKYNELMPVGCTGCAYCMPCPAGVRIPTCFELYNTAHMFKEPVQVTQFRYEAFLGNTMSGNTFYASQCVECGQCLEHCPQHIEIPSMLAKVAEYCEADGIRGAVKGYLKGATD